MTDNTPGAAEADYDDWEQNERDRDEYLEADPSEVHRAFCAGWRRGVTYLARAISDNAGSAHLPQAVINDLLGQAGRELPPGG